jgi:hypothetical protein
MNIINEELEKLTNTDNFAIMYERYTASYDGETSNKMMDEIEDQIRSSLTRVAEAVRAEVEAEYGKPAKDLLVDVLEAKAIIEKVKEELSSLIKPV